MLSLGPVTFQGFEIPEKINVGGRHALVTHKLPGGGRVIDAMGRDDDDIAWSGRFRGGSAGRRARAVDALRIAGQPITLSWDAFRYTVLVSEFQADFQQAYEIPYRITCLVVTAQNASAPSPFDLLSGDLSAIATLSDDIAGIEAAVSGVQAAVATAKALGSTGGILGAISAAKAVAGQLSASTDALLGTETGDFAATLLNQATAATRMNQLQAIAGNLGRMAATLS